MDTQSNFGWGYGYGKQNVYFIFDSKTRHKSVSRDNVKIIVTGKEM